MWKTVLVIILGLMFLFMVGPASAGGFGDASASLHRAPEYGRDGHIPPLVDAIILRPAGLVALAVTTPVWLAGLPFAALSPYGVTDYTRSVMGAPVRFVFTTPLGGHR